MNLTKSCVAALFVFLCSIATTVSADVVVYSDTSKIKLYYDSGTNLTVHYADGLSVPSIIGSGPSSGLGSDPSSGLGSDLRNVEHNQVFVVTKLATYWVKPAYGPGRIRVTVPMQLYLTSWDVKALEKELERLGVKVKPKPLIKTGPKPGPVISG